MYRTACLALTAVAVGLVALTAPAPRPAAAQQKTDPKDKAKDKEKGKDKAKQPAKKDATPPADLSVADGFKVELLYTADPAAEGSWINLCTEKPGKLIVGGQTRQPVLRVTIKDGKAAGVETLKLPISETMGLLYAFDSLYVTGSGPQGFGLYRCREQADGTFDVKVMKIFGAGGEHGAHAVVLGPDKNLYVINGNHTNVADGLSPHNPLRNYREDHLLPRQPDGNGHATGRMAPGGVVYRTDPDGKNWEMVLGGFRNAYDMAFNGDGELFAFDSDMEWDWGMPWYRPTRVNHLVSGAEFGWRYGTGKWPAYYPDSLGSVVDIGIGSPTGVSNGIGAKFPAKYQKAIYLCDWTYGRLIAVHLTPKGAGYTATFENFVAPLALAKEGAPKKPLNLTDAVVGSDGAMYFTTGGRNTQGALYRVTYTGSESTAPAELHDAAGAKDRATRRELEAFHGAANPKAVGAAWPHLGSPDRNIRYAARVAVEAQPVAEWQAKALAETNPTAALTALLALARCGDPKSQPAVLAALARLPLSSLPPQQQIDKLRVLGLSFIRQGRPTVAQTKAVIAELDPLFPSADESVNRELAQVLIYLHAPGVAGKCLKLMAAAKTQEDAFHYLFHLRTLPIGFWTLDQRKEYFGYWTKDWNRDGKHPAELLGWFKAAGREFGQGSSFNNFLKNFLRDAASNLSDAERTALAPVLAKIDAQATVHYDVKPRAVVKQWKTDDLLAKLDAASKGRNMTRGREAYIAAQCVKCHRFGDEGGAVGPDLTAIAARFTRKDILESMTDPSKVISDQYQNERITTADGKTVVGRVVDETKDTLVVQPDPLSPDRVTVKKAEVEGRGPSKVSPMPANLIDVLTEDEILDLIAFMESGKNPTPKLPRK